MSFADRIQAGQRLAEHLAGRDLGDAVILALPRGGVPVAAPVAAALDAPLDVLGVRKLGAPHRPEFGVGAVAENGVRVVDEGSARLVGLSDAGLDEVAERERAAVQRAIARYRGGRGLPDLFGKTIVVVDDGLATGVTAEAAVRAVRAEQPARVLLAVPVGARDSVSRLQEVADEVVVVVTPEPFMAVGAHYARFDQTSDEEVLRLLDSARRSQPRTVTVPIGDVELTADLALGHDPAGLVVFAHGSGSSRHSARNQAVARALRPARLATLLLDLLTAEEEEAERHTRHLRFDIGLLAQRVSGAVAWAAADADLADLPVGCFGASTGAGAALVAAASPDSRIAALVSGGGRPDLAGDALQAVRAPTLLLVGGADTQVLELNRHAQAQMTAPTRLEVIPGAGHLFAEPGTLEQVATHARDWFRLHLVDAEA